MADNTFATPFIQRPLNFGFDIVVHSVTKYINGHSDMIGGIAVVGENAALAERLGFLQNSVGANFRSVRQFSGTAGREDAGGPDGTHRARTPTEIARFLEARPEVEAGLLSRLAEPSAARIGQTADVDRRRNGQHDPGRRTSPPGGFWRVAACLRWPKALAASKAWSNIPA